MAKAKAKPKAKPVSKSGSAASVTSHSAALVHGTKAFGARYVKPGFSFSPEQDFDLALGWPHFKKLVDGHPDDDDPEAAARASLATEDAAHRSTWPRKMASRLVRVMGLPAIYDHANIDPDTGVARLAEEAEVAFGLDKPITVADARTLVTRMFSASTLTREVAPALLLLEAFVGPDEILDAAVTALSNYEAESLDDTTRPAKKIIDALGFILLRVPAAEATRQRTRLEAVYRKSSEGYMHNSLHEVLHGAAGVDRAWPGYRIHVLDDPAVVTEGRRKKSGDVTGELPDPRIVFLGGEATYEIERPLWKKYELEAPRRDPLIVERMGVIRSPITVDLMAEMATASKARKQAEAWLATHADYARPSLERLAAGRGDAATRAKAALRAR